MRIDEKSLLAHILEQVVIVLTIPFLPGRSVDVRVVQEEDNFFFFHNALSCSRYCLVACNKIIGSFVLVDYEDWQNDQDRWWGSRWPINRPLQRICRLDRISLFIS